MDTLTTIVLFILFISFMTFVAFFGRLPALRNTPIAWLHRFMWDTLPSAVLALDQKVTGGRLSSCMRRFGNHMLYDRHPTVLIFYIVLLFGGEALFIPTVWPLLSATQRLTVTIFIACPYIFLWLSATSDPGYITPENHTFQMAQYPFDFAMFHPGAHCRTCQLLKPARSKHCSICKHCIAKSDHHCIFINNCVGAGNLHWFILLLLSTAVLLTYGTCLGLSLLNLAIKVRYPDFSMWPPAATNYNWDTYFLLWSHALQSNVGMGAVTLLMLLTAPLVWGLWAYNIYMIWAGTTTNESLKWSDWKLDIADGYAYRRCMSPTREKDLRFEPAWTKWPVESQQIMIHTDNGPPRADSTNIPGRGEWTRVVALAEVDNLYDLGFWDNLRDVFWPRYRFAKGGGIPVGERVDRGRQRERRQD
ncbi:zf-DHHC-domain-containing protein [Cryphonectria parasitica EP155]|uniref:Palmitoyltransferase n=1 Tax=Cryphonectria parasitica (strain ATCC 38755 / EP155) TaxID=660469 RepID=A0A9P5CKT2_CRYP1|nr:zf-DHHC-domain-containing protein [Cryphonectria parasitica EP155]KAF3761492.1 zf-DHHC-domain-containing protein [Cryphonectria parasitica EP155]